MPAMPLFISVSEAASLPNRCFIDVRSRVVHGWDALGAYSKGHIAGAQFLAFDRVFARDPVFGLGRHPWSDRRTVAAHLLGVLGPAGNAHHRVIFYDDGGMNFAARAALCARWAGFMPRFSTAVFRLGHGAACRSMMAHRLLQIILRLRG